MKTAYTTLLLLLFSTIAFSQESVTVSVGGGRSFSSATLKQHAFIGNGTQAGADVFVPLLRKGWDGSVKGSGKLSLGILAGTYYQSAKHLSADVSGLQSKYKLYTGDLDITNNASNSQAFAFSAGLQANLTFGRITLSPSISGGYLTSTQDVSTQHTQVMMNGTTQKVLLSASPEVKTQGLIMIPQLKVGYRVAGNLSVYASGSVNAGPATTRTQHDLIPSGGFNDKNTYEATQLASGKLALDGSSKEAAYITTSIQAGLSWSFGKSKVARKVGKTISSSGGGGAAAASYAATGRAVANADTPRTARQTPNTSFGARVTAPTDTPHTARQTPNTSFGARVTAPTDTPHTARQTPNTSFGARVTAPTDTPPAGKQTQGATFGEKVNQGLHAAGSAVAQGASLVLTPGNPIGGIIVKGGKNPGGSQMTVTTDNKGEFEFTIREAGNYQFVLTAPDESTPQGRSISEKGVKRSDNPIYKGNGQSGENPMHGAGTLQGKSISEQGVKKSDNPIFTNDGQSGDNPMQGTGAFVARPGQPIKGVIVRGGKKPGGNMISITTNGNGVIDMNGLTAGKYKFIVTAP